MKTIKKIKTHYTRETIKLAKIFTEQLQPGNIIGLIGELGTGKTQFTKGIALGLGIKIPVNSPSYTIINIYNETPIPLFHFDLYRLSSIEELENIGYEEYFYSNGITIIEWADKCLELLPDNSYIIYFKHIEKNIREITICQK